MLGDGWTTFTCLVGIVLLFSVAKAVPAPGHGAGRGYCNARNDCPVEECCVSFVRLRGRRAATNGNIQRFYDGSCQKLGTLGSDCFVEPHLIQDLFSPRCPCADNLFCQGSNQHEPPYGETGTCVSREEIPCNDVTDCLTGQCCVSNTRPIGKRSVDSVTFTGKCKPMGSDGSECLVNNGSGVPGGSVYVSCPCSDGLTCIGTGVTDIPLGEIGKCGRRKRKGRY